MDWNWVFEARGLEELNLWKGILIEELAGKVDKDVGVNLQIWNLIAKPHIGATNLGGDSKGDDSHIEAGKVLILEEKGFYFLLSMIYKMMTLTLPERPQSTSHRAGAAPLKYEVGRILPFYHYLAGHKFTVSYHQGFQMTKHDL